MTACGSENGAPSGGTDHPPADSTPPPVRVDTPEIVVDTAPLAPNVPDYEQLFLDSGLVDVQSLNPAILVELKYSTTDNFVHTDVYGDLVKAYLRPLAAEKLAKAQDLLSAEKPGYALLVYDAARPRRVQYDMWEILDVPYKRNYLAPPEQGSIHNYGFAVDLTLSDSSGKPLDMGTEFDFFGELAQPKLEQKFLNSGELSAEQHENRLLLRRIMRQAGFYDIKTEWWHFNAMGSLTVKSRYHMIE